MLCSEHFEEDCFEKEVTIAALLSISRRRKLKPSTVPSIFKKRSIKPENITGQAVKRCNTDADEHFSAKMPRTAYEKRERARASELFLSLFFFFGIPIFYFCNTDIARSACHRAMFTGHLY